MFIHTLTNGPLSVNTYILQHENECIIIDPASSLVKDFIVQHKLDIKAILLTHGHFDHIGGIHSLLDAFGALEIYASKDEAELLASPKLNLSLMQTPLLTIYPTKLIKNNDILDFDWIKLKCLSTPGHTQGCMSYLCNNVLFAGDTLFKHSYGRYDFPTGSISQLKASIKMLLALDSNIIVYSGHGESSTIEEERLYNPFAY